jgi:ketosteroid isomerase-like protein
MSDPHRHARVVATQEFLMHIGGGDLGQAIELLAPNVTYWSQGHHAMAGIFHGPDGVARHIHQFYERTRGTYEAFKWEDWMIGEHNVVGLADIHAQADGRIYRGRSLILVSFNSDDKIDAVTVFFQNQDALDRFIGP